MHCAFKHQLQAMRMHCIYARESAQVSTRFALLFNEATCEVLWKMFYRREFHAHHIDFTAAVGGNRETKTEAAKKRRLKLLQFFLFRVFTFAAFYFFERNLGWKIRTKINRKSSNPVDARAMIGRRDREEWAMLPHFGTPTVKFERVHCCSYCGTMAQDKEGARDMRQSQLIVMQMTIRQEENREKDCDLMLCLPSVCLISFVMKISPCLWHSTHEHSGSHAQQCDLCDTNEFRFFGNLHWPVDSWKNCSEDNQLLIFITF